MNAERKQLIIDLMRKNGAVVGYLFGSYARGTNGPLSDIDVAVAFPVSINTDDQGNRVEDIRGALERIYGRDKVDVVNVPKLRTPLLRYIITLGEGEVLFADDRSLLNRLADLARRDYEDTKPLRAIQDQYLESLFA
jgi:predicted nucleotidyltransferase